MNKNIIDEVDITTSYQEFSSSDLDDAGEGIISITA